MLEIHLVRNEQSATRDAASDLINSLTQGRIDNPFKRVTNYIIDPPRKTDGRLDVDQLIEEMRRRIADPKQPDPDALVLGSPDVNLHDLRHLKDQVADHIPGLFLGVDFSG